MFKLRDYGDYLPVYAGALAFIGVLVVATHITIDRIAGEQLVASRMIDMASNQRMLSQRVARLTLEYTNEHDATLREDIRGYINDAHGDMLRTHLTLTRGDVEQGIPAAASDAIERVYYDEPHLLDQRVRLFLYDTRSVLEKVWSENLDRNHYVRSIVDSSRRTLLASLEDAAQQFVSESFHRVEKLRFILKLMNGTVILTLIAIGVFVFNPLFKAIAAQRRALTSEAQQDPLTGSLNRRSFMMSAEGEFARAKRYGSALSLLVLDIDKFKDINDTRGHAAGDAVIKALAQTSTHGIRQTDIFGRIGGEEFAIIMPETRLEEAALAAEKLREVLANSPAFHSGKPIRYSVSIGVSQAQNSDNAFATMLHRGDLCLYAAKHLGRNRVISRSDEAAAHVPEAMSAATVRKGETPASL